VEAGVSRSKYVSQILRETVIRYKDSKINRLYDEVFSDESVRKEQLETSKWFDGLQIREGQEWY